MKILKSLFLVLTCWLGVLQVAPAQPNLISTPAPVPRPVLPSIPGAAAASQQAYKHFDLDFPGGPPKAFVAALEKALAKPVNVIVPEEFASVPIMPLKLRDVTFPQVFDAIAQSGTRNERYIMGYRTEPQPTSGGAYHHVRVPQYANFQTRCGFRTADPQPSEGSIWYFYYEAPPPAPAPEPEPKPVASFRCWQLGPTLESYSIDDITTAIETTWKMLGTNPLPKMSFHKETKLLIVVGTEHDLSVVNSVLDGLSAQPNQGNLPNPRRLIPPSQLRAPVPSQPSATPPQH